MLEHKTNVWIRRTAGRPAVNERILPACAEQMVARENREPVVSVSVPIG